MESNGVKGRIHVSQATADALIASGKEHWLTEREDRIVAKGKGEMITYFVQINPGTSKSQSSGKSDPEEPCFEEEDRDVEEQVAGNGDISM